MYCKHCGKEISDDAKFCDGCGKSVTESVFAAPTPECPVEKPIKKKKKPFYKKWWFWVIIILLLLGSCGAGGEESVSETLPSAEGVETQPVSEVTTEPTTVPSLDVTDASEVTVSQDASLEAVIDIIEALLKDSFANYETSYEDGIITIDIWEDGIATGATLAAAGDTGCLESWNILVESQKQLSSNIYEIAKNLGLSNVSVVINILNDLNTENVLLSTFNGIVLFDAVNEQ